MENRIKALMDSLQAANDKALEFDGETILSIYQKNNDNRSLTLKIMSVFGGLLGSLAFMGFFFMTGLYDSILGLVVFGTLCIVGAIWINKKYHKTIIDTLCVSSYIIGLMLLGMGIAQLVENNNLVCLMLILIAVCTLVIVRSYMLSLISVLVINSCILALISINNMHGPTIIYISVLALVLTYIYLKEAKLITIRKAFFQLYGPIRAGLTFSFLSGLIYFSIQGHISISPHYIWPSSLIIIAAIVYIVSIVLDILNVTKVRPKFIVYILSILILLPTVLSPAISGAILIVLLSFLVNYKTGFGLGIVALIYFIGQYYYDLDLTLLTKSILLFSSGVFFLALYMFTHKKLTSDDKI